VVWPGVCVFPDFTNPETRAWWGEQQEALLDVGIAGIWSDMNEPRSLSP
jgi:alpha-glucosidase